MNLKYLSKEEILAHVTEKEIFEKFLGTDISDGMCISSPLREDKNPSFSIFQTNDRWYFKDHATGDSGDCWKFVEEIDNLNGFKEVLKAVTKEFGLSTISNNKNPKFDSKFEGVDKDGKPYTVWTSNEPHQYWGQYKIPPELLISYGVKNIVAYQFYSNRKEKTFTIKATNENPIFGFQTGLNSFKIYRPFDKKYKHGYIGKFDRTFIFGYTQLPVGGQQVFITGGNKDALTLNAMGHPAISFNSESANIPEKIIKELKQRFNEVIILYDNDETGILQAIKISEQHGLKSIQLPQEFGVKDISDFISEGNSKDDFEKILKTADRRSESTASQSFVILSKKGESLPDIKMIFGAYITEKSTSMFVAERGSGKTYLMLQICVAISAGWNSFLGEKIELHGNSLFINFELGENVMLKRLAKLYQHESLVLAPGFEHTPFLINIRGSITANLKKIEAEILKIRPVLVVIDNLRAAFMDKDNESNKEMTKAISELNQIRDKYGFALVLVHHTKKGTSDKKTHSDLQSGAGAISDLVDGDFFLRRSNRDTNLRLLKRVKSREFEEQKGAKLIELDVNSMWFELIEDSVSEYDHIGQGKRDNTKKIEKAISLRKQKMTIQEIADRLDVNKSTVSRWINNAVAE